ncbi:MAG: Crp/Fnr family transcriptional regulator [Panacagrimonas sp.]
MPDLLAATRAQLARFDIADEALAQAWADLIEPRQFARGKIVLQAGDVPTHCWIIMRGVCRYYYTSFDGRERNKAFFREGGLVGSMSAIFSRGPAPFSIDVSEDSLLGATPLAPFFALARRFPLLDTFVHRFTAYILMRNEQREAVLLTGDMETRYRWVQEHEPWLLERVPQYQVASYLGMDPVSLSRLKQKKAR